MNCIEIEKFSFRYPQSETRILKDINMEVEMPGQIINMGPEMRELNIIMAVRASHLRLRTAMQ